MSTLLVLISSLMACAGSSDPAPTHLWKVGGEKAHFADVQSAVDAASDGDVILIRSGNYTAFTLRNKSLSILSANAAAVNVSGEISIESLAADKLALLSGLNCQGLSTAVTSSLVLHDNSGAVVLRNSAFLAMTVASNGDGREGMRVTQSETVVIDTCQITGSNGGTWNSRGGQGMWASGSNVASFRSTYAGGQGGDNPCDGRHRGRNGFDGGHGYESPDSFLFAAGDSFRGGRGGDSGEEDRDILTDTLRARGIGGTGGAGIFLGTASTEIGSARLFGLAVSLTAGAGGPGGCGDPGVGGSSQQVNNGSFEILAGATREITLQRIAFESSQVGIQAAGVPGETVYLMVSRAATFAFDASKFGCQLVQQPSTGNLGLPLGVVPASGVLNSEFRTAALPSGDEAGTFLVQAVFVPRSGPTHLSNATAIAVVDSTAGVK